MTSWLCWISRKAQHPFDLDISRGRRRAGVRWSLDALVAHISQIRPGKDQTLWYPLMNDSPGRLLVKDSKVGTAPLQYWHLYCSYGRLYCGQLIADTTERTRGSGGGGEFVPEAFHPDADDPITEMWSGVSACLALSRPGAWASVWAILEHMSDSLAPVPEVAVSGLFARLFYSIASNISWVVNGWQVFEHSRSMLFCPEIVPASGLVLMDVPALNQFTFESAVQGNVENIEAG
ncbi:hypothetical protein J6590_061120 [Homalodisca vitripennis]|nr:hypothetical protein J6590_061120 [Homalodisca vitripennis]